MDIPIGTILKEWQSYVTTISRNLMELSEQTDVKIIKFRVKDTANGYTGLTKTKAVKAVDDLDTLWRYYALLSDVVDRARSLYSKNSFLNNTEDDVKVLLENTPITLETEHIDISNRGLLSPEHKKTKVSLQELLKLMQDSFEATRNTFTEISHAAETLKTKLIDMENEISNLYSTAQHLGIKDMPLFEAAKVTKIESDPLQGLTELDTLFYKMENYKASIKSALDDYNETSQALHSIKDMLSETEDLAKKSENAILESQKIFGAAYGARPVISQDVLNSLKDWLAVLENKQSEGSVSAAKIGALRLEKECTLKLNAERENYYSNSKDYNEWLDLKGEFNALLAKFNGLKARGMAFDNSLNVLTQNIQAALGADRVNLVSSRELIKKFHLSLKS